MSKYGVIAGLMFLMVLFLIISLTCVAFVFSPVVETERDILGQTIPMNGGISTQQGVALLAQAWLTFPDYNGGLATIAVIGLIGAGICGWMAGKVYYSGVENTGQPESVMGMSVED